MFSRVTGDDLHYECSGHAQVPARYCPTRPMSLAALHDRLLSIPPRRGSPALLCITGASGTGKTAALAYIRNCIAPSVLPTLAFDSLGVPPTHEMELGWDTPRAWQKAM